MGREAERDSVDSFVDHLADGARVLLIRGDAGIGKTAMWRYGVERCRAAGHVVLVTRPTAEESLLATSGLVDLLEDVDVGTTTFGGREDPLERGRVVLTALRGLAADRPVVLAIDDLQWLDSVSARALRYALRRFDDEPIGVLATLRADGGDPLDATRSLPPERCASMELGPLGLDELRGVLSGVVASISRPALGRIHAVSGGNPLFAIELARVSPARQGRLPESLNAAISATLEQAPPELAPLLDVVAVLGRTNVEELSGMLEEGDPPALLASAEAHELLVVGDDLGVRYAHPLVGSAVYERIGPLARRSLHARAARLAADPDIRARHLALSTDVPDGAVAELLEEAAARARSRGASDVAADFAGRSARLTPPADESALRRRSLAEIQALASAGEVGRALELADRLLAALAPGPARVEALVLRADLENDDRSTAEALLLGALDEAGDDPLLRGQVLHRLAQLRRLRIGDVAGAIDNAREALALAERAGDPPLRASAAAYLGHLEALAGSPRPELMEHAIRLAGEQGSIPLDVEPRVLLAKQRLWAGDIHGARALLDRVQADAARTGDELRRPQAYYDLALVECAAGDLAAAESAARQGLEAALDAENAQMERELLYPFALVLALLGRADEARSVAARLEAEADRNGVRPLAARARCVRGALALSEDDLDRAAELLADGADAFAAMGFAHPGAFPVLPDAIEACAQVGDLERAESLLARLEREAAHVGSVSAWAGAVRGRGVVLLGSGAAGDAAAVLEGAYDAFAGIGFLLDAARARLAQGSALLRDGRRSLAAEVLADARGRFAATGASLWEARAAAELDRAAPGRAAGELTATERHVAALVADGLKNREIAARLFMGLATVEAHLTRIYRKLGIRSRSELVRLVADGAVAVSAPDGPLE